MITTCPHIEKLDLLRTYMNWRIDRFPGHSITFNRFIRLKYPKFIPGTTAYAKANATHCFYCNKDFSKIYDIEAGQLKTIDHFFPQSADDTDYQTNRLVICCYRCNQAKLDLQPGTFLNKFAVASMNGWSVWGLSPQKVRVVYQRAQTIFNDIMNNKGQKVYYITDHNDFINRIIKQ